MARYVKFVRGTPEAYAGLIKKDQDTLYFIRDNDADDLGALYLGGTLISGNGVDLGNLGNVVLEKLQDKDLLSYDAKTQTWINKSVINAIDYFTNNATGGLVPKPNVEKPSEVFLRGDGIWARLENHSTAAADNTSIENVEGKMSLKDFGRRYYKYIPSTGTEGTDNYVAAHYELQVVDSEHPWLSGLEPRVVMENNEYVLGWFEPNLETTTGLANSITILSSHVSNLEEILNSTRNEVQSVQNDLTTINKSVVNLEDYLNNVYTKTEVDALISNIKPSTNSLFTDVNNEEFLIDDNKQLNIKNISISKVVNLESILNSKASQATVDFLDTRVGVLEASDFVTRAEMEESIKQVNQSAVWGEL